MLLLKGHERNHCAQRPAICVRSMIGVTAMVLLLGAHQRTFASGCLVTDMPRGESRASVGLMEKIADPYFYFRSFDYNFAVLVIPASLRGALESAAANGNKDAKELLALVTKDLPLDRNTDLFKYVLADSYQLSAIQRTLVNLLERGEAAVFDAETGRLLSTISGKRVNSDHVRSRTFYASGKTVLLQSLDCIEN